MFSFFIDYVFQICVWSYIHEKLRNRFTVCLGFLHVQRDSRYDLSKSKNELVEFRNGLLEVFIRQDPMYFMSDVTGASVLAVL